jgi:hypothetical protein
MKKYGAADGKVLADDDTDTSASDQARDIDDDDGEDAGGVRGDKRTS